MAADADPVPPNRASNMLRLPWAPMTNKAAPSVLAVLLISVWDSTHLQHGSDRDVHPPPMARKLFIFCAILASMRIFAVYRTRASSSGDRPRLTLRGANGYSEYEALRRPQSWPDLVPAHGRMTNTAGINLALVGGRQHWSSSGVSIRL